MPNSGDLLSTDVSAGQMLSADPNAAASSAKPQAQADHPILTAIASVTGVGMPALTRLLEEAATNPAIKQLGSTIGRTMGAIVPTAAEAMAGSPAGTAIAAANASKSAWAGGKAGWFTAKMLQDAAGPLAKVASAVEPYMPAIAALAQECDTLGRINSPASIGALAKSLKPEQRAKILAFYKNKPELSAIIQAMK